MLQLVTMSKLSLLKYAWQTTRHTPVSFFVQLKGIWFFILIGMVKGVKGEGGRHTWFHRDWTQDIGIGYFHSKLMISWAWPIGSTSIVTKTYLQIFSYKKLSVINFIKWTALPLFLFIAIFTYPAAHNIYFTMLVLILK